MLYSKDSVEFLLLQCKYKKDTKYKISFDTLHYRQLNIIMSILVDSKEGREELDKILSNTDNIYDRTINLLELDFAKRKINIEATTVPIENKVKYIEMLSEGANSFSNLDEIKHKIIEVKARLEKK